jgi:hypothetical protein
MIVHATEIARPRGTSFSAERRISTSSVASDFEILRFAQDDVAPVTRHQEQRQPSRKVADVFPSFARDKNCAHRHSEIVSRKNFFAAREFILHRRRGLEIRAGMHLLHA